MSAINDGSREEQTDCLCRRFPFFRPAPVSRAKNRSQEQEQQRPRDTCPGVPPLHGENVSVQEGDALLAGLQKESLAPSSN